MSSSNEALIAAVKADLLSGRPSQTTVSSIQQLLKHSAEDRRPLGPDEKTGAGSRKTRIARNGRSTSESTTERKVASKSTVQNISDAQKRRLATEFAALGSKVLAEVRPRPDKCPRRSIAESDKHRALQPRSSNTTPSPEKSILDKIETHKVDNGARKEIRPLYAAQCAHLALAHLRTTVTADTRTQLLEGSLAFCRHLLAHGLIDLAFLELGACSNLLYKQPTGSARSSNILRCLLYVGYDEELTAELWRLAVVHQTLILRAVSRKHDPRMVEDLAKHLSTPSATPLHVVERFMRSTNQTGKAAIYLENMVSELLSICPKLSISDDANATDRDACASPLAVFSVQVYALHLRRKWWLLAKHEIDVKKALCSQYARVLRAYTRRAGAHADLLAVFKAAETGYDLVFAHPNEHVSADYDVLSNLHALASAGGSASDIERWTDRLGAYCSALPDTDCRRLTAMTATLYHDPLDLNTVDELATHLSNKLQGRPEHYASLIQALARLLRRYKTDNMVSPACSRLARSAVRIVSWTAKTYPDLDSTSQQSVICSALRSCSRSQLIPCIDERTMLPFIRGGVLTRLSQAAATHSLKCTYMSSPETVAFGEIVDILVLKQLKTGVADIDNIGPMQSLDRGLLLEWKLRGYVKYGGGTSGSGPTRAMCKAILSELNDIYSADTHPIRRALVRVQAGLAASKGLVSINDLEHWEVPSIEEDIKQDEGLTGYIADAKACLEAISIFEQTTRSPAKIGSALRAWHEIFDSCANASALDEVVYDKTTLAGLLESLASLCAASGWQQECLHASTLRRALLKRTGTNPSQQIDALVKVSEACISIGQPHQAYHAAEEALSITHDAAGPFDRLKSMLAAAEARFAQREIGVSRTLLDEAHALYETLSCRSSTDKKEVAMLCARAWWLQSALCLLEGDLDQAIGATRLAASIVNTIWNQLEDRHVTKARQVDIDATEASYETGLADKVSKLRLTATDKEASATSTSGPVFWNMVPIACGVLMHTADVYVHAGLFTEAHLYATRAIAIADCIDGTKWRITARSKLASILTLAGRTDDAELCLAKLGDVETEPCIAISELYRARARLCAKTDDHDQALEHYDTASRIMTEMNEKAEASQGQIHSHEPAAQRQQGPGTCKSRRRAAPPTQPKDGTKKTNSRAKARYESAGNTASVYSTLCDDIAIEKAHIELKLLEKSAVTVVAHGMDNSKTRQLKHLQIMSTFATKAGTDVVFNALLESSIICPGVQTRGTASVSHAVATRTNPKARSKTQKASPEETDSSSSLESLLRAATAVLQLPNVSQVDATHELHKEGSMLVTSSIISKATNLGAQGTTTCSPSAVISMSLPTSIAKLRERSALSRELLGAQKSAQLTWPVKQPGNLRGFERDAAMIDISDILPTSWTVVSLQLNVDASELIAMRQSKDEPATIVRLPFARQDFEADNQVSFDFAAGKAELVDIVTQSNSICHAGNKTSKKVASATWWKQREELDKRLHELLVNIEEIWFGGFKGVLCPDRRHEIDLPHFRREFESVLERHLLLTKVCSTAISLPDTTLRLFLNLCHNQGCALNIDASVLDLLYCIVDTFRFHGCELAYDEIDFDSLTVEVINIIQAYHDRSNELASNDQHLILVLDKRLQNFPWESLPFLENTSVSRMGDMLSLRDRIVSMNPSKEDQRHCVDSKVGTVILDPAADMKRTQDAMEPALRSLLSSRPAWRSSIGQAPSEDQFREALTSSSIVMYFGHGAGSQYIRPRTVKKLDRCSEVVWLMGCSSGAVAEYDELEATSVPSSYLLAAKKAEGTNKDTQTQCLAVVANLWDVTDKDIDRFSIAAGEDWRLWSLPVIEHRKDVKNGKRGTRKVPSTPHLSPKTPKASRDLWAEASSKSPRKVRTDRGRSRPLSLSEAISRSRDACYLRYLNGAAPVVYGVPVYLNL